MVFYEIENGAGCLHIKLMQTRKAVSLNWKVRKRGIQARTLHVNTILPSSCQYKGDKQAGKMCLFYLLKMICENICNIDIYIFFNVRFWFN